MGDAVADHLVTAAEAARLVGRNPSTVGQWIRTGALVPAGTRTVRYRAAKVYRAADVRRLDAERARDSDRPKSTDDMTAEELDAFVAERMANPPSWWASETKVASKEVAKTLRDVVKSRTRGRKKK